MKRAFLLAAFLGACASQPSSEAEPASLAPPLPAARWADEVARAHAAGDLRELAAVARSDATAGVAPTDAVETRQGLYAHAAQLALERGAAVRAQQLAAEGLLLAGGGPSRAQLFILASRARATLGDEAGAAQARRDAEAILTR